MSFDSSTVKRTFVGIWGALCVAVLIFAVVQREYHDMDIAFTYFMFFLSFPSGLVVALVLAALSTSRVYLPAGLVGALVTWPFFVVAGYFQWFVLLPAFIRWLKRSANRKVDTDAREGDARGSP